jgi:hypothetical protein
MRYCAALAALLVFACDDAGSSQPVPDTGPTDASPPDMRSSDAEMLDMRAGSADAGPPDATPDAMADAAPQPDMMPFDPPPPGPAIEGEGARLPDGITPVGEAIMWTLPADWEGPRAVQVEALLWRWEDGQVQVQFDAAPPVAGLILGDADAGWRFIRATVDAPPLEVPANTRQITIQAQGGPIGLSRARLAHPLDIEPPIETGEQPPADHVIAPMPCGPACDDGADLTVALAEAPADGWVEVQLAGTYHLQTPWQIRRDRVRVVGADARLEWDPLEEAPRAAIDVRGGGPQGPRLPIEGAIANGQRRFVVTPPEGWTPRWVRIVADDFGHIPRNCVDGRDQEQYQRHMSQLVEVLAQAPVDDGRVEVLVDRPVFLDIPAEANPAIQAVELRAQVHLADLHLLAACPQALESDRFRRAACDNPAVIEDDGLAFHWTVDSRADRVLGQGFGKFTINATHALRTRITDCRMDHPSDYGEGGKGYGVHLITASRSVVRGSDVRQARHGVVVDFGSSDSQVLDGVFSAMNQAFIDVHGEASRDTLIRGNRMFDGPLGVIVGGGGNIAHCNDGPRHHVHQNHTTDISNSAVTVFDETREVYVRDNDLTATLIGAAVAFDSEARLEGNIVRQARLGVQAAAGGRVFLRDNVFTDACSPEDVGLSAQGEIIFEEGNRFCPEE